MDIDDETLMALADGEIDGEDAAGLLAKIAADPALADRYALFTRTSAWVRETALTDPEAEVSPDLATRIRQIAASQAETAQNVSPIRRPTPRWQPIAIAASLALAIGLSAGVFLSAGAPSLDQPVLTAGLKDRLGTLPSGAQMDLADGRRVSVIASFTDQTGALCREYEIGAPGGLGYVSVSCLDGADWSLRFAIATASGSNGYAPAASLEALDAFYAATGASQPLSVDQERVFLDQISIPN